MSKDVKFNTRLSIDGKDQVVTATAKNGVTSFEQLAQALPKFASKQQVTAVAGLRLTDNVLSSKGQIGEFGYVC